MVKALCFDVIGTVVDWRGTIMRELDRLFPGTGKDWSVFARDWAGFYAGGAFKSQDDLAEKGRSLLQVYGLTGLTPAQVDEFVRLWDRLDPWADAVEGLDRLQRQFKVAALTNCGVPLVESLSGNAGLAWDVIISAEEAGVKKPDPKVYALAAEKLGLPPSEIMLVAAHLFDLKAAQKEGFHTAYVERRDDRRPKEEDRFDYVVSDFIQLAERLAAL